MNYSYIMGINNIDILKEKGFQITEFTDNEYGVIFNDEEIPFYEDFICNNLENGFWNEYLGKDKIFIFKFLDGTIKRFVLDKDNEGTVLELCRKFANNSFESIDKMLRGNDYYREMYYKE